MNKIQLKNTLNIINLNTVCNLPDEREVTNTTFRSRS